MTIAAHNHDAAQSREGGMDDFAEKSKRVTRASRPSRSGASAPPDAAGYKNRPTMTDVAAIAGVSQSSVSLVLNKMAGARISEATRARVLEAARSIGYEPPGARRAGT